MRKKDLIRLLRNTDDQMTEQLSRDYPGMTDAEREVLFQRIEQRLAEEQAEVGSAEAFPVIEESRFPRMFQTAAAAVCMLALCGTFAGLFWMKAQMQDGAQTEVTDVSVPSEATDVAVPQLEYGHHIGERYAAENLTQSGTLFMTVTEAVPGGELFRVELLLESKNAVSIADSVGKPYLFMADNFMAATGQNGENWTVVSPCRFLFDGKTGDAPYTIEMHPGQQCSLTLWFKSEQLPEDWKLVTSCSTAYSYTVISMKEE